MNEQEAREKLAKMKRTGFVFRLGMLGGIAVCFAILGFSFVRPHLDFIITVGVWPSFLMAGYFTYLIAQLNRIEAVLQSSEEKTT